MANDDYVPVIGVSEPKETQCKFYVEGSLGDAILHYQHRERIVSFSAACRKLLLIALEDDRVFGGYVIK